LICIGGSELGAPALRGPRRTCVAVQGTLGQPASLVFVQRADEFEIEWGHGNFLMLDIRVMSS
jgi:hypothetical protein